MCQTYDVTTLKKFDAGVSCRAIALKLGSSKTLIAGISH